MTVLGSGQEEDTPIWIEEPPLGSKDLSPPHPRGQREGDDLLHQRVPELPKAGVERCYVGLGHTAGAGLSGLRPSDGIEWVGSDADAPLVDGELEGLSEEDEVLANGLIPGL